MVTKALRRFLLFTIAALLWAVAPAHAQNSAIRGWCETGNTVSLTSGIPSTTLLQASYPSCTVTVFIHGGALASGLTQDAAGTQPLSNPFTAQTNGQYFFYATPGSHFDIQLSGGLPFPGFPSPVTLTDFVVPQSSTSVGCLWPGSVGTLIATNGLGGCQSTNLVETGSSLQINDSVTLNGNFIGGQLATFNSLLGIGPGGNYFTTFTAGAALSSGSLVKLTAAGTVTPTAVTDSAQVVLGVYIDSSTAAIGQTVHVATFGPAPILIDASGCTAGQALIQSPSIANTARCTSTPGTAQVIGQSLSNLANAGLAQAYIYPLVQVVSTGGGGGAGNPGGTNTQFQINNNGVFGGIPLTYQLVTSADPKACIGAAATPCNSYFAQAALGGGGFNVANILQFTGGVTDTIGTRGNKNQVSIQAAPQISYGSIVAVYSVLPNAGPTNAYPSSTVGVFEPQAGLFSQTACIGGGCIARGALSIGTDDFQDSASGQTIIGAAVGAGLSKLSGSLATAVGLDVLPTQSYALNGSGVCCNTVTETAANIYGIRINGVGNFATTEQAAILINNTIVPTLPSSYSIKVNPGGGAALFSDGIADATLTPNTCVQTQLINSILRLVSAGSVCGTAQASGPAGAIQYAGVGGAFSGDGVFTRTPTGTVQIALANLSTDISPFTISWATNNAGVQYGGVRMFAFNTSFATGSFNYQFCGGPSANNCVQIDPFANIFTPGGLATGNTGVAGSVTIPQGPLPGFTFGGTAITNAFQLTSPTSIPTNYQWVVPSASAGGLIFGMPGTNIVTLAQSGDANHALAGTRTSALPTTTLCSAGNCPQGEFVIHLALQSTVVCATPGPATITPTWTFTDVGGAKSSVSIPMQVNGSTTLATTVALGNATNWASNLAPQINSTGVAAIQLAIAYTACTTGTGTYHYAAEAVQLQ